MKSSYSPQDTQRAEELFNTEHIPMPEGYMGYIQVKKGLSSYLQYYPRESLGVIQYLVNEKHCEYGYRMRDAWLYQWQAHLAFTAAEAGRVDILQWLVGEKGFDLTDNTCAETYKGNGAYHDPNALHIDVSIGYPALKAGAFGILDWMAQRPDFIGISTNLLANILEIDNYLLVTNSKHAKFNEETYAISTVNLLEYIKRYFDLLRLEHIVSLLDNILDRRLPPDASCAKKIIDILKLAMSKHLNHANYQSLLTCAEKMDQAFAFDTHVLLMHESNNMEAVREYCLECLNKSTTSESVKRSASLQLAEIIMSKQALIDEPADSPLHTYFGDEENKLKCGLQAWYLLSGYPDNDRDVSTMRGIIHDALADKIAMNEQLDATSWHEKAVLCYPFYRLYKAGLKDPAIESLNQRNIAKCKPQLSLVNAAPQKAHWAGQFTRTDSAGGNRMADVRASDRKIQ